MKDLEISDFLSSVEAKTSVNRIEIKYAKHRSKLGALLLVDKPHCSQ